MHIKGLERLGAKIYEEHGAYVRASAERLKGAEILLRQDHNALVLKNCSWPTLLKGRNRYAELRAGTRCSARFRPTADKMGANREGGRLRSSQGVDKLHGAKHRIIPDRIEAATFTSGGRSTHGDLNIAGW